MSNKKNKVSLNPIMTLMILIVVTIVLSGVLALFGVGASYDTIKNSTYESNWVAVESLFNLRGIKYIFQSTVSNFAAFTPLSMLIIILGANKRPIPSKVSTILFVVSATNLLLIPTSVLLLHI